MAFTSHNSMKKSDEAKYISNLESAFKTSGNDFRNQLETLKMMRKDLVKGEEDSPLYGILERLMTFIVSQAHTQRLLMAIMSNMPYDEFNSSFKAYEDLRDDKDFPSGKEMGKFYDKKLGRDEDEEDDLDCEGGDHVECLKKAIASIEKMIDEI